MCSILGVLLVVLACDVEARTWTSQAGSKIDADFVKAEDGNVWLKASDGKMLMVSFNALVADDQAHVRTLCKEMQEKAAAAAAAADAEAVRVKAELRAAVQAKWKPGQVASYVTADETRASYHVYIPASFDPDKPPPLVYAFSPSGNGRGQLNSMMPSAEKAGWIVVGCDKIKNGMEEGELRKEAIRIEDAIIADVQQSIPHDAKHVYLSGFSGGAMQSYRLTARRTDIKFAGVLAFGGWLGGLEYQKLAFPRGLAVAMINGDEDNNANAWVDSDKKVLKRYGWKSEYFSFPGGHAMAPPEVIDKGMEWILNQPLPK